MVYLKSSRSLLLTDPQHLLGTSCKWLESNQDQQRTPLVWHSKRLGFDCRRVGGKPESALQSPGGWESQDGRSSCKQDWEIPFMSNRGRFEWFTRHVTMLPTRSSSWGVHVSSTMCSYGGVEWEQGSCGAMLRYLCWCQELA